VLAIRHDSLALALEFSQRSSRLRVGKPAGFEWKIADGSRAETGIAPRPYREHFF
jgi:hypothetical protein